MSSFAPPQAPSPAVDEFLSSVYTASNPRNVFSVTVTGGGTAVIADLFTVPGASNSLMHASVPYSRSALSELLDGPQNEHSPSDTYACSKETANLMAKAIFKKTVTQLLADNSGQFDILSEANIFGVGCTAALVSSRPRRGLHRCHVSSFSSQNLLRTWEVCFRKGLRTRRQEDNACSRLMLDSIAASCALPTVSHVTHPYLAPAQEGEEEEVDEFNPEVAVEVVEEQVTSTLDSAFEDLFSAHTGKLVFIRKPVPSDTSGGDSSNSSSGGDGSSDVFSQFTLLEDVVLPPHCFVYPGSYNPLHIGHISLAAAAMQHFPSSSSSTTDSASASTGAGVGMDAPLVFEISALNADKAPLTKEEILRRVSQFAKGSAMDTALRAAGITNVAVCVTSRPYFQDKASLFPRSRFIVGADTLSRLFLPKYYQHSRDNMIAAVADITQGLQCSFVVGGRKDESGFCDLDSVLAGVDGSLPDCVRENLFGLTDEQFRCDLSSTEIRNSMKK